MNDCLALSRRHFLSLHYIAYGSTFCNHGTKSNYCQLLLMYTAHPLTFLFHPIFHTATKHYLPFFLYSSSHFWIPALIFTVQISIILSYRADFPHSAIKIKSSAYSNSRGKSAGSSLVITSITVTHSRGHKTDHTFTSNSLLLSCCSSYCLCTLMHRYDGIHQPFLHSCLLQRPSSDPIK